MTRLVLAVLALVASHVFLSAAAVRPWMIARMGRTPFMVLHAAVSTGALVLVVWAFQAAPGGAYLYDPVPWARPLAVGLMPVAFFLVLARLTTRFGEPDAPRPPCGIYRVCRFPGSLGLLLWLALHLPNLGEERLVVVFLAMLTMVGLALFKNQTLYRMAPEDIRGATSLVPFAAILAGRQSFIFSEIGWWRIGLTLVIYLAFLHLHPLVFGVDPLAGLM